ncbi:MAG TPA: hypothetical protein VJQ57_13885 [Acidimicrobiia bacterium]|nr:hypothetical protein [Acidimicrobiia bacterium]
MTNWLLTIDLSDQWDAEIPFEAKRDAIVARLRSPRWRKLTAYPDTLTEAIDAVEASWDIPSFDAAFAEIHDLADSDRVWIET